MRKIISILIVQQLLYPVSVESLTGSNVIAASYGEFPFVASIRSYPEGHKICTGTLITRKHVITVAHCLNDRKPDGIRILFETLGLDEALVAHTVASWTTYDDWADSQGIQKQDMLHDIALVQLTDNIYGPNVNPIPMNVLHKQQLRGKEALIVGWWGTRLRKAFVKFLSDEECEKNVRLITNNNLKLGSGLLCTAAKPHVLLDTIDSGAPILDATSILGVSFGATPNLRKYVNRTYSEEFLQKYQVNLHFSFRYYKRFVDSLTGNRGNH